jgi:hypothetical protein
MEFFDDAIAQFRPFGMGAGQTNRSVNIIRKGQAHQQRFFAAHHIRANKRILRKAGYDIYAPPCRRDTDNLIGEVA